MKYVLLALATLSAAALTSTAQAKIAAPYWTCQLNADLIETDGFSFDILVARREVIKGYGVVSCEDLAGQKTEQQVSVKVRTLGVGLASNEPLQKLSIKALAKGLSRVDGMIGRFQLSSGIRYGFINQRRSVMGGWQLSGLSSGAKIEAVVEDRHSIGIDAATMALQITAVSEPVLVTRY